MPLQLKKHRKWFIVGTALLLTAPPSFALFGIGDVVFDPQSYASLVQQLTMIRTQYNMLKNNITHFSIKRQWQTTLHTLENVNVANMFGETAGIKIALSSMEDGHSHDEQRDEQLPARAVARQRAYLATRHGGNLGLHLSRLPYRRRPVPERQE